MISTILERTKVGNFLTYSQERLKMRSFSTLMILSLLIVAFMAMSVFGASAPTPSKRVASTLADKMIQYSFPDDGN